VIESSLLALTILVSVCSMGMVVFGSLIYFAEGGEWDHTTGLFMRETLDGGSFEVSPYKSIPGCFWWVVVTMTTVGYGDVSPTTSVGHVIGTFTMFAGILTLALPITVIGANFQHQYQKLSAEKAAGSLAIEQKSLRAQAVWDKLMWKAGDISPSTAFKHWRFVTMEHARKYPSAAIAAALTAAAATQTEVQEMRADMQALREDVAGIAKTLQLLVGAQVREARSPTLLTDSDCVRDL
jgi:hypothetical protein